MAERQQPLTCKQPMRILVVEDESDLSRIVSTSLREDGYAVDVAEDGEEGLYKAKSWDYDTIVLDVMLPKRNGWNVLAEVRKLKPTPVLMLTARDAVEDRVKGLDGGADDYLVKPFELKELKARVRALIRRSAGKASSSIEVGDIVIDTVGKTVTRAGTHIDLTAREYSIVEFLALHLGKVVSRSILYDHLFDEDDDSLSNLLDVHISNIRRKVGKDFITTRRGQGYQLE